jgi:hypothetical protein
MYTFPYTLIPDDGLVEAKTSSRYVNVYSKIYKSWLNVFVWILIKYFVYCSTYSQHSGDIIVTTFSLDGIET